MVKRQNFRGSRKRGYTNRITRYLFLKMPVPAENRLTFQKKCGMIAFAENERAPAGRVPAVAVAPTSLYANVAQSVEQLIRNQQVVCSSHIISSKVDKTCM